MDNEANVTCEDVDLSPEQSTFLRDYLWWMRNFGHLPVGLAGIFLNSIALIVLSTSSMRTHFFNRLLFCLAIFDNIYLSCEISEVFRHLYQTSEQFYSFIWFIYPVRNMFMFCSAYMTIALAHERYQAITNPVEYRNRDSQNMMRRLSWYVLPILTCSFCYYCPKFLDLNVGGLIKCMNGTRTTTISIPDGVNPESTQYDNCTKQFRLTPTELRINHHYILWYINISNMILTAILPVSILIFLNCRTYKSLNRFNQRRPSQPENVLAGRESRNRDNDVKKTFILFWIVIVFILCHALRILLNIEEFLGLTRYLDIREKGCSHGFKFWFSVLVPVSQLFIIINSSVNFFIYSSFDPAFKKVLRQVIIIKSVILRNNENMAENIEIPTMGNN